MSDKVYFPDEVENVKKELADSQAINPLEDPPEQVVSTTESTIWKSDTTSDKMYFPDEEKSIKKKIAESEGIDGSSLEEPPKQVDSLEGNSLVWKSETTVSENVASQRIIFPDEYLKNRATEIKSIEKRIQEDPPEENFDAEVTNMIVAPPNCPKGQQMGADGVCRDVF